MHGPHLVQVPQHRRSEPRGRGMAALSSGSLASPAFDSAVVLRLESWHLLAAKEDGARVEDVRIIAHVDHAAGDLA